MQLYLCEYVLFLVPLEHVVGTAYNVYVPFNTENLFYIITNNILL